MRRHDPAIPLVADSDLDGATRPGRGDSWFITQTGPRPAVDIDRHWTDADASDDPGTEVPDTGLPSRPLPPPAGRPTAPVTGQPPPDTPALRPNSAPTDPEPPTSPGPVRLGSEAGNLTFRRIFSAFVLSRALLGGLLLLIEVVLSTYTTLRPSLPGLLGCVFYAALTGLTLRWAARAPEPVDPSGYMRRRWLLGTVGVDLAMFSVLLLLLGNSLNVAVLYALPVLMAGTLSGRRVALASAAVSAIMLLGIASLHWLAGGEPAALYTQAGLAGAGLFVMAALTGELASRLTRQEQTARSTLELARQQALLNRLVIEEMQEGLMVVDRSGHVRTANPAALSLIGAPERPWASSFELRGVPNWAPLAQAVEQAFGGERWPESGRDVRLRAGRDAEAAERQLRLRVRFTRRRSREVREPLCVLFLEDVRTVQARARQEKLAAMGRVSAGIAHEIRNPLAAIAQANALLGEDLQDDPHLSRLTRMVSDNVERLRRIVDDVQAYAPSGPVQDAPLIELTTQALTICEDWARTNNLAGGPDSPLHIRSGIEPLHVRFDPEHLRRVLVNLLDNALRHGSGAARSVWVQIAPYGAQGARLWVASDGAPIAADVEPYLFEPFFSTRSRGSGLGLYICRELCERHGATIEFRLRRPPARHRNSFVVTMPRLRTEPVDPPTPPTHERPAPHAPSPSAGR
ncbi:MAG: hypothetical protein RJA44_2062 [Pseudomonadota bacterium]|jgi:two-component system sensor histidine kinase PilS (NtrC family)